MKAVIMAGGKGTRLHDLTKDEIPKAMALVHKKPIIQWQIECLKREGIQNICIITGHLGEKIRDYFEDGSHFGVQLNYYQEESPMGTAGALAHLEDFLVDPFFVLVFGDVIFDINISRMVKYHLEKESEATLFVHPNSHPFDSDLVVLADDGKIIDFDSKSKKREYWYDNIVNAGFYILAKSLCADIAKFGKIDLEKDILLPKIKNNGKMFGYLSTEYVKDVGTISRIDQAQADILSGIVPEKNLSKPQKCIFLDRDGTLNIDRGLIGRPEELILEESAAEAIRLINESGYLAVLVTNQPVVARGLCNEEDVNEIHRKLKTLLGEKGAFLDAVEYCPHHPDKGYPDENPIYKIPCGCRKPGTDMVMRSVDRLGIDLDKSWMIGDTTTDIMMAQNVGIHSVLVQTGEAGNDGKHQVKPTAICKNVLEAVKHILNNER